MADHFDARRLWILGSSCAGKSTLAAALARARGLRHVALDELFWQPSWTESEPAAFTQRVEAALADAEARCGGWVLDGNYSRLRTRLADRVEHFVWLDLPRRVLVPRLVVRTSVRLITRRRVCGDNRERLLSALSPKHSLLVYMLRHFARHRREAEEFLAARPHVRLRSRADVRRWLGPLSGAAPRGLCEAARRRAK